MGAWGTDTFEHDNACDYAGEVAKSSDLAKIESTFDRILKVGTAFVEATDAEEALAAADIIARLKGNFGRRDAYTEEIDKWVGRIGLAPPDELVEKARLSIARIMTQPSELLDLWSESHELSSWRSSVEEVPRRLGD